MFNVDGWNLKNDKNIALGGVSEKKKNKKSKNKSKSEISETQINDAVNNDNGSKPPKKDQTKVKGNQNDSKQPKNEKKRKNTDEVENKESITNKRSKSLAKVASNTTIPKASIDLSTKSQPPIPITSQTKLTPLQQKMMSKLSGSRFRWINEQLYTITSEEALKLIKEQPSLFDEYHQGFKSQVSNWPENPVQVFVDQFKNRLLTRNINAPGGLPGNKDKTIVVADMGCGEAQFSQDINKFIKQQKKNNKKFKNLKIEINSFDLKKQNEFITVADIKNVPMENESCSIVIFCLALMGTNFIDFIKEAYRILQPRGELWIAEIKSRFSEKPEEQQQQDPQDSKVGSEFVDALKLCGFFHKSTDNSNKMFTRFEFFKPPQDIIDERNAKLQRKKKFIENETEKEKFENKRELKPEGEWLLKPCIYKRR
ncbi:RRP8 [Candida pseudojiufengensis]|uniref:RRP8 n=1 Tax=Candida pseudojiufengensis TaxID=497109 RepID=UPI00222537F3|nr:RRP8 [Candida pseudojiufengensis]KAI5965233.1 RRP8 [Candida pseudojiufengensis]